MSVNIDYSSLLLIFKKNFDIGVGSISRNFDETVSKAKAKALVDSLDFFATKMAKNKLPTREWSAVHTNKLIYGWLDYDDVYSNFFSEKERDRLKTSARLPISWRPLTLTHILSGRIPSLSQVTSNFIANLSKSVIYEEKIDICSLLLAWATQIRFDHANEIDILATNPNVSDSPIRNDGLLFSKRSSFSVLSTFQNARLAFEDSNFEYANVSELDVGIYAKLCYLSFSQVSVQTLLRNKNQPLIKPTSNTRFNVSTFREKASELIGYLSKIKGQSIIKLLSVRWLEAVNELGYDASNKVSPQEFFSFGDSPICSYRNAIDSFRKAWLYSCTSANGESSFYRLWNGIKDPTNKSCWTARYASDAISLLFPADVYYDEVTQKTVLLNNRVGLTELYRSAYFVYRKPDQTLEEDVDYRIKSERFYENDPRERVGILETDEDFMRLTPWQRIRIEPTQEDKDVFLLSKRSAVFMKKTTKKGIEHKTEELGKSIKVPMNFAAVSLGACDSVADAIDLEIDKVQAFLLSCIVMAGRDTIKQQMGTYVNRLSRENQTKLQRVSKEDVPKALLMSFLEYEKSAKENIYLMGNRIKVTSCSLGWFGRIGRNEAFANYGQISTMDLLFKVLRKDRETLDGACIETYISDEYQEQEEQERQEDTGHSHKKQQKETERNGNIQRNLKDAYNYAYNVLSTVTFVGGVVLVTAPFIVAIILGLIGSAASTLSIISSLVSGVGFATAWLSDQYNDLPPSDDLLDNVKNATQGIYEGFYHIIDAADAARKELSNSILEALETTGISSVGGAIESVSGAETIQIVDQTVINTSGILAENIELVTETANTAFEAVGTETVAETLIILEESIKVESNAGLELLSQVYEVGKSVIFDDTTAAQRININQLNLIMDQVPNEIELNMASEAASQAMERAIEHQEVVSSILDNIGITLSNTLVDAEGWIRTSVSSVCELKPETVPVVLGVGLLLSVNTVGLVPIIATLKGSGAAGALIAASLQAAAPVVMSLIS